MKRTGSVLGILMVLAVAVVLMNEVYAQSAQRTGEITKIDAENRSFVIKTARGETNILTKENTLFKKGEREISFSDLMVGDHLVVTGVRQGSDVEAGEVMVEDEQDEDDHHDMEMM